MRNSAWFIVAMLTCSVARAEKLAGIVFREDGSPAAGASVTAAAIFRSPPQRFSATADEQGIFWLDLPKLSGSARYALAVRWQMQGADITDAIGVDGKKEKLQGQRMPTQAIRLRVAGRLRGKLLRAEDDGPLAGAQLFLDTGEILNTDDQGGFEIAGLAMKDHSLIPVAPGRHRQYVLFDTTNQPDAELELRLPQGAVVKGQVTDESGRPVPSAYLHRPASGTALTLNGWDELCQADGSFAYGGLPARSATHSLEVVAPGYRSQTLTIQVNTSDDVIRKHVALIENKRLLNESAEPGSRQTTLANQATTATQLPRRTIEGVVQHDGRPISHATVRWGRSIWDSSVKPATSDESGRYVLKQTPDGRGALLVIADGFAPQFAVVGDGDARVDVSLSRGTTVRGVVRGSSGSPLAGVHVVPLVHCLDTGICNPIWLDERATRTNDQGEFEIVALPATGVQFDFMKQGFSDQRNVALQQDGSVNRVTLSAGGAVSGRVIDEHGQPVRNFKIRIRIPRNIQKGERAGGYYAGFDWYGLSFTRHDGAFVFTDVGAETWLRLIFSSPGVGCAVVDRVQARALDALPRGESLTVKLAPFRPLVVTVKEAASGKPIADALVGLLEDQLISAGGFHWGSHDRSASESRTAIEGEARFKEPACEDGTIIVKAAGFARRHTPWTDGARQISISLEPEARLEGEVRFKSHPLREGNVELRAGDQDFFSSALSDNRGRFLFDGLPAGEYQLIVSDPGGKRLHITSVRLTSGATVKQQIEL